MGKVIPRELCKKLQFDQTTKNICTTKNPSQRIRDKTLLDFEIEIDDIVPVRRQDLVMIINITYRIVDFPVPVYHSVKNKESEKRRKFLDLVRQLKK